LLRNTSKALSRFTLSHNAIRDWIQKYKLKRLFYRKTKIAEFIIDETLIKVGSEYVWLWVAIDSETKNNILATSISKERNMFVVAERFLSKVIKEYSKHPVSTDGGDTWYQLQTRRFLKLDHHIHFLYIRMRKISRKNSIVYQI
jgi:putative transposase